MKIVRLFMERLDNKKMGIPEPTLWWRFRLLLIDFVVGDVGVVANMNFPAGAEKPKHKHKHAYWFNNTL